MTRPDFFIRPGTSRSAAAGMGKTGIVPVLCGAAIWLCAVLPLKAEPQRYPDVLAAKVTPRADIQFDFDVTISSPYDTPTRYADGFRVLGPEQKVYGERKLLHDHQDEQPFTRDLYRVTIPPGVVRVTIQARDQQYGYGGKTVEVRLPGR